MQRSRHHVSLIDRTYSCMLTQSGFLKLGAIWAHTRASCVRLGHLFSCTFLHSFPAFSFFQLLDLFSISLVPLSRVSQAFLSTHGMRFFPIPLEPSRTLLTSSLLYPPDQRSPVYLHPDRLWCLCCPQPPPSSVPAAAM
jgi:hypothetical protein